jgi:hypothetical protein
LGLFGTAMMTVLLAMLVRGLRGSGGRIDPEVDAIASSVRACALSALVAGSLASGSADPGIVFMIPLAVVLVSRVLPVEDGSVAGAPVRTLQHSRDPSENAVQAQVGIVPGRV